VPARPAWGLQRRGRWRQPVRCSAGTPCSRRWPRRAAGLLPASSSPFIGSPAIARTSGAVHANACPACNSGGAPPPPPTPPKQQRVSTPSQCSSTSRRSSFTNASFCCRSATGPSSLSVAKP
jgi:hypothetical protein